MVRLLSLVKNPGMEPVGMILPLTNFRDIKAGETIFTDTPAAVGPDSNPKPGKPTILQKYRKSGGRALRLSFLHGF